MKRVLGERPDLRSQGKKIVKIVSEKIKEVESLTNEKFIDILKETFPEIVETPKIQQTKKDLELPPLKNLKPGTIKTRLAPEPSGHPHIGHAYAFFINQYYARRYEGKIILRFEDTNPSKVALEYYDVFRDALEYLNINWDEEIIESNFIDIYYQFASDLIDRGKAYVCKCPTSTVKNYREEIKECSHRSSPIEEVQHQWKEMLDGSLEEGEATLRLKLSMEDPNPVLRDPAVMRITHASHPLQGDQYSVWPLYDFAVSIEDGLRGITHIFRSEEFHFRIPLQNQIQKLLGLPNPQIIHFSRLRMKDTPVQKRLIRPLIETKVVSGWDDIRLSTIAGLRRRGILPEAIKRLTYNLNLTKAQSEVEWVNIFSINRKIVDPIANRYFAVINPIKLNVVDANLKQIHLPLNLDDMKRGNRTLNTDFNFYIDSLDIKSEKLGSKFRLKDLYNIKLEEIKPEKVIAKYIGEKPLKNLPKVQWVPVKDAIHIKLNIPSSLFLNEKLNPNSLKIYHGWGESNLSEVGRGEIVHLERIGFGCVDSISNEMIEINMTEPLSYS